MTGDDAVLLVTAAANAACIRRRARGALGAESRALLAAVVRRMRETGRPLIVPVPS